MAQGTAFWMLGAVIWGAILAFKGQWVHMAAPIITFLICLNLRPRLDPVFYHSESAKNFGPASKGLRSREQLDAIESIQAKLKRLTNDPSGGADSPTPDSEIIASDQTESLPVMTALHQLDVENATDLGYQLVRDRLNETLIANRIAIEDALASSQEAPRGIVLQFLANVSGDELESASYHVYRGVLNTAGDALLITHKSAWQELVDMNRFPQSYADEQIAAITNIIKMSG
jgi:hypothetical protein